MWGRKCSWMFGVQLPRTIIGTSKVITCSLVPSWTFEVSSPEKVISVLDSARNQEKASD